MQLKIRVLPRSSKNEIVGKIADGTLSVPKGHAERGGTLKIKLTAPPVDGAANDALIEILSTEYKIPKSRIKIISGLKSKNKVVEI